MAVESATAVMLTENDGLTKFLVTQYTREEPQILIKTIDLLTNVWIANTPVTTFIQVMRETTDTVLNSDSIPIFPAHAGFITNQYIRDDVNPLGDFSYATMWRQYIGLTVPLRVWKNDGTYGISLRTQRRDATNWNAADRMYIRMMGTWLGGK